MPYGFVSTWHIYAKNLSTGIVYKYMSTSPNDRDEHQVPPKSSSTVILMAGTIADTTWRMFVPTVGFTLGGLLLDKMWSTTPWIMIAGIVLGVVIAILLVRMQIKKVSKI